MYSTRKGYVVLYVY